MQSANPSPRTKQPAAPFAFEKWEEEAIQVVFGVALDKEVAHKGGLVWLKALQEEMIAESPDSPIRANSEIADRLLIGRLELDPEAMSDDQEQVSVLTSLPPNQTTFEYLVDCWKRLNAQRHVTLKKGLQPNDLEKVNALLEKLRDLIISYAGLTLQEPTMFPQPQTGKPLGAEELLPSLYALGTSTSVFSSSGDAGTLLDPGSEVEPFLIDIAKRFDKDGLEDVLGGVVRLVVFSPSLAGGMVHTTATLPMSISPTSWRSSVSALQCLFSIKQIAAMITGLPEWNPPVRDKDTTTGVKNGKEHEVGSILGMVMRLGIFARDWPAVLVGYYKDFDTMTASNREASDATLKSSLSFLRSSLFNIVNSVVRAGPEPREAFLAYVARVVQLNQKRAAMRFKYETQASDSFIHNLNYVLLRLAEPFMDAQYKQLDKIDLRYYEHSSRISLTDLTRINATPPEIEEWENGAGEAGPAPNFVSDVFYLLSAVNHLSTGPISSYISAIGRHVRDIKQQLEMMEKDESWRGGPAQAQVEAALKRGKEEVSKLHATLETIYVAILHDDFTSRCVGFASFVSVWLLRLVDPTKQHPRVTVALPLPEEVPLVFKVQPEYMFDDVVEFWDLMMKYKPTAFEFTGQKEIVDFSVAFLTSAWYITNPYLKSKLVTVLAIGVRPFRKHNQGILGGMLCTHQLSLNHLMMCLMKFYVECEKTGTHTQFYDKFQIRRDISEVMQSVWRDPTHRSVMENFTSNLQEFIKFANRLMNDVTFMLDELLTKLAEIKKLQQEMDRKEEWDALTQEQREDKISKLKSAESIVEPWIIYSREFLALLIEFTGTTKAPFVSGEIVGRLAAMLNYVLDQLAGPRCADLRAKDMDKYGFDPKETLTKVLQIYNNLSGEAAFVEAIASEGRSYRKSLFENALRIARNKVLMTSEELDVFEQFARRVEEVKQAMDEEDIEDFPEEFEDPLMATLMRDPVFLPTSKTTVDMSTIKSHLLSDPTDPFNRVPLKIEDVVPNLELKQRIDAFIAERKSKAAVARLASMEGGPDSTMDTTE